MVRKSHARVQPPVNRSQQARGKSRKLLSNRQYLSILEGRARGAFVVERSGTLSNTANLNSGSDSSDDLSLNREFKSDVFTDLFGQNEYAFQLFQSFHPEDTTSTVEDLKIVTLSHVLTDRQYNDLGFRIGDRVIILVEHQSTWTENIVIRIFLYIAQSFQDYINEHELNFYSSKKIKLPKVEAYVVYTGHKEDCPDVLSLNKLYWDGDEDYTVDVRVKVLRDGKKGDILNQYVEFLKVLDDQIKIYGRTKKAIREAIRICKEHNILREYLKEREPEVISIMISLFSQEKIQELYGKEKRQEGWEEGWEEARAEFSKREAELKKSASKREAELKQSASKREAELREEAEEAVEKTGREKALEFAKKLLITLKLPFDSVSELSGLPLDDVARLAKSLGSNA